jgi:hypothetical protein
MSLREIGTVKDTTVITLRHPDPRKPNPINADGTPMTVTIHGPYSVRYKAALRERQQAWLADSDRSTGGFTLTPDEVESSTRSMLIACIEDWSLTLEGEKKLPFSPEAAEQVFAEFPWVYEQVAAAAGSVSNFLDVPEPH